MQIDRPDVVAEVKAAFARYEQALGTNDVAALNAMFRADVRTIRYGRAEMGQGSFTALPQILTEELECDWAFVKPEYASANRNFRDNKVYGSLSTGGSRAVCETGEMVQQAGASARERLIAAAAKRWNVPATRFSITTSRNLCELPTN